MLNDGKVLITGGFNFDEGAFASAELYDPATGIFTATGDMTQPRANHTAILLNDGNVLITGGFDAQAETIATAELFDATTGTFSPTSAPASVHTFYGATLLNDGTVLVVGGFVFPNPPGDGTVITEVFDPTTNKFNPTGSLLSGRFSHTVTLLNNGQVLVTGGQHETNPTVYLKLAQNCTNSTSRTNPPGIISAFRFRCARPTERGGGRNFMRHPLDRLSPWWSASGDVVEVQLIRLLPPRHLRLLRA